MNQGPANTSFFEQLSTGFSRLIGWLFEDNEAAQKAQPPQEYDYFELPPELLVPLFKVVIKKDKSLFGALRLFNRASLGASDRALAEQYGINDDLDFRAAFKRQQAEIDYLLRGKPHLGNEQGWFAFLDNSLSTIKACFKKLEEIPKDKSIIAYHARELAIQRLNAALFREKVKEMTTDTFFGRPLNCVNCIRVGLTRLCIDPDPHFLKALAKITILFLGHNRLTTLPPEMKYFTGLIQLWVTKNQITHLPAELAEIPTLEFIDLSDNQLRSLPENCDRLHNLRIVYLQNNKLKTIPMKIGDFPRLEQVHLEWNQLQSLPEAIPDNVSLWGRQEGTHEPIQLTKAQLLERQYPQEAEPIVKPPSFR